MFLVLQPILKEGGNYIIEGLDSEKLVTVTFSMSHESGSLADALDIFKVSHSGSSCDFLFV